jgi:DNA polymerase III alpha subunit
MIPLFKSDFSIGKSILTLNTETREGGPASLLDLAVSSGLEEVVLVEDSLTGFLKAKKNTEELGLQLIFGLRLNACDDASKEPPKGGDPSVHKIIIFARTGEGCILLNKIYSFAFTKGGGRVDCAFLKEVWDTDALQLVIPFYDSFIFNNLFHFSSCLMDFNFASPTFFIEDNLLPLDYLAQEKVMEYCNKEGHPYENTKSIYYNKRADFSAYQTYKCICKRSSFGRGSTLEKPNLDHCGSNEFCFESWHEKTRA